MGWGFWSFRSLWSSACVGPNSNCIKHVLAEGRRNHWKLAIWLRLWMLYFGVWGCFSNRRFLPANLASVITSCFPPQVGVKRPSEVKIAAQEKAPNTQQRKRDIVTGGIGAVNRRRKWRKRWMEIYFRWPDINYFTKWSWNVNWPKSVMAKSG